jgi:hypothetical protein
VAAAATAAAAAEAAAVAASGKLVLELAGRLVVLH